MSKPLILVTNDDGIDAPGLLANVMGVKDLGDVVVASPECQQSAMGRSLMMGEKVGSIKESKRFADIPSVVQAVSVYGTPAQSVHFSCVEVFHDRKPDLVVSGINLGCNLGSGIPTSGTIGAAQEGWSLFDIPAMAVSAQTLKYEEDGCDINWDIASEVTKQWAQFLLENPLPEHISLLNINIPQGLDSSLPSRKTRVSRHPDWAYRHSGEEDLTLPHRLKLISNSSLPEIEDDSDIKAISDKVVSVSPLAASFTSKEKWAALDAKFQ